MSFDRNIRNALARMVGQARELLKADVMDQLLRLGFQPDGSLLKLEQIAGLSELDRVAGRELRDLIEHFIALESGSEVVRRQAAYDRLAREIGFTTLNRLVALRMAEERGLIVQAVGRGLASDGFQIYERIARDALGNRAETYRAYLECLYDELALDLPLLFDRTTPESRIFPSERCLEGVLVLLNDASLAHLWKEDEAIGWVYQYYNDPDERKKMREVQAPRNSRELAVRNQFFTPRYVVEFLGDNTLGRLWYEMQQGNTKLIDQCHYLVHRPIEKFLQEGEEAPQFFEPGDDSSPEELLNRPAYISFRAKKDPRDLKVLDPACGSGHFLLYAFDLLATIYEEAWADSKSPISSATGSHLQDDYADLEAFYRAVPELIIRHNLYGIDIDPRACQIAALALWLRAQRNYQQLGVRTAERPQITKSNIVCAEPMPGEQEMFEEYLKEHVDPRLQSLVRTIWKKMQLASEAGSLLKIEEEIETALVEAREQALVDTKPIQLSLLQGDQPVQLRLTVTADDERSFWEQAEEKLLTALRDYASKATNGHLTQRRLFVEDAAQGFALIDLCRNRFDIMLMNPPFGQFGTPSKAYIEGAYPDSKEDIDAAFVRRGVELVHEGFLGAIINRTQLFKPGLRVWRERNLLDATSIEVATDLGLGVLDSALVEAATYVLRSPRIPQRTSQFFRLLKDEDKASALLRRIEVQKAQQIDIPEVFTQYPDTFRGLPESRISYWANDAILSAFKRLPSLEGSWGTARQGSVTSDNFRFLRLCWEVPSGTIAQTRDDTSGDGKSWVLFAKGGEYSPYFQDLHLLVKWKNDGGEIRNLIGPGGRLLSRPQNLEYNFRSALTYSERTASGFSPRICPPCCVYSHMGPIVAVFESKLIMPILGILMSRITAYFIELMVESADAVASGSAARHYTQGIVGSIPIPALSDRETKILSDLVEAIWDDKRMEDTEQETGRYFVLPALLAANLSAPGEYSLKELTDVSLRRSEDRYLSILQRTWQIEEIVKQLYKLDASTKGEIEEEFGLHPEALPRTPIPDENVLYQSYLANVDDIIDEVVQSSGGSRSITKKTYFADRKLELLSAFFNVHPSKVIEARRKLKLLPDPELIEHTDAVISYAIGCVFGRWDIRMALNASLTPKPLGPLEPLTPCAPGMLIGPDGLPSTQNKIVSEEWLHTRLDAVSLPEGTMQHSTIQNTQYPITLAWNGILVDDPDHSADIVKRIREVLAILWPGEDGAKVEDIEREASEILGMKDLREYFRRQVGFFANHLQRYSKSRRQAPIYWPLSTTSGAYTLWIYYHRLTSDTLFTAVNQYVEPKITEIQRKIGELERRLTESSGREATRLSEEIEDERTFLAELQDFRAELLRIAALPYRPDLNDGVIINAAPLHRLFRLPKWAKDTKECWEKLQLGEYDWSHLSFTIWPDRVREKCRTDRSIAIAQDLEDLHVEQPATARKKRSRIVVPDKEDEE